jgi:hypothetical protein
MVSTNTRCEEWKAKKSKQKLYKRRKIFVIETPLDKTPSVSGHPASSTIRDFVKILANIANLWQGDIITIIELRLANSPRRLISRIWLTIPRGISLKILSKELEW